MNRVFSYITFILLLFGCSKKHADIQAENELEKYKFDLQGHRGARGLAPENTIPAFRKALQIGVNTLELDVVISKDKKVVVSHEPWFNPELTITPNNERMEGELQTATNFYQMDYDTIKQYDVGSLQHPNFPHQKSQTAYKPLLMEVLEIMEKESKQNGVDIHYNIEIKSRVEGDNIYHPSPSEYIKLVLPIIQAYLPIEKFNIQSFDFRVLKLIHHNYPKVTIAALVEKDDFDTNLKKLGFTPDIYSPNFTLVNKSLINKAAKKNVKVIPWTVNMTSDMKNLLKLGVDGIITDYPNRALQYRL